MLVSVFFLFLLFEVFPISFCFQILPSSRVISTAFTVRLLRQRCISPILSSSLFKPSSQLIRRRLLNPLLSSVGSSSDSPTTTSVSRSNSILLPNGRRRRTGPRPVKAGKDIIQVVAQIIEKLKNKSFHCELVPSRQPIKAQLSGRLMSRAPPTSVGDYLTLELSPYDLTIGRVVWIHGRQMPNSLAAT
jgi:translation initiation factor IF-1